MTPSRLVVGALCVTTALLLAPTAVARLPLPGSAPDVVLLVVLAFALAEGPFSGAVTGAVAGLLADLMSDHAVGRLALAYVLVGHLVGSVAGDRSPLRPFAAVAAGAAGVLVLYTAEGLLLGDPRTSLHALLVGLVSSVPYTVVLAPFVVPLVALLVRGTERDRALWS